MIINTLTDSKIVGVEEGDNVEKEALTALLQAQFGENVGVEFRGDYELRVEVDDTPENDLAIDIIVAQWAEG